MEALTLNALESIFEDTLRVATPHREPDFDKIRKVVDGDVLVRGQMVFIEEHNTGYDGVLERWMFNAPRSDGTGKVSFMADLLPGQVKTENRLE
jgi:hypothetical protein